jgi:hypothetical protein
VEDADVAEAAEIKLERFRFEKPFFRHVVDHEVGEVRLAGDRAERGEFRRGEARDVVGVGVGIGDPIEYRRLRRGGEAARLAEMTKRFSHCPHPRVELGYPEFGHKRGSKRSDRARHFGYRLSAGYWMPRFHGA